MSGSQQVPRAVRPRTIVLVVAAALLLLLAIGAGTAFVLGRLAHEATPIAMANRAVAEKLPAFSVDRVEWLGARFVVIAHQRQVPGFRIAAQAEKDAVAPRPELALTGSRLGAPLTDAGGTRLAGFARLWVQEHPGTVVTGVAHETTTTAGEEFVSVWFAADVSTALYAPEAGSTYLVWQPGSRTWRRLRLSESGPPSATRSEPQLRESIERAYPGFSIVEIRSYERPGEGTARPCVVLQSKQVKGFRWVVDAEGPSTDAGSLTSRATDEFFAKDPRATSFMRWWAAVRPGTIVSDTGFRTGEGMPDRAIVWYFGPRDEIVPEPPGMDEVVYHVKTKRWELSGPW